MLRTTLLAVTALLLASPCLAAGAGGGAGGLGSGNAGEPTGSRAYEKIARKTYERGVRYVKRALELEQEAGAPPPGERPALPEPAVAEYRRALRQFDSAISRQSDMHEIHSDRGFVLRKLGDYEGALASYDRALELAPGFAPAIEYRGEAYLELGRLEEAKTAYLALAVDEPNLAQTLLAKMRSWLARQRENAEGHDPATVEAFGRWVEERDRLAQAFPVEAEAAPVEAFRW